MLNHFASLAKLFSVRLGTKWFWVSVQLQSLKFQISCQLRARSSLNVYLTWQEHAVKWQNFRLLNKWFWVWFHLQSVTWISDFDPASSKEFPDIQATIECGFTLKRLRYMKRIYSIMFLKNLCFYFLIFWHGCRAASIFLFAFVFFLFWMLYIILSILLLCQVKSLIWLIVLEPSS